MRESISSGLLVFMLKLSLEPHVKGSASKLLHAIQLHFKDLIFYL